MDTTLRGARLPAPRFRLAPLPEDLLRVRGFKDLQTFFPTLGKIYRISKHQSDSVWLDSKWRVASLDISGTSGPCEVGLVANVDLSGAAGAATVTPSRQRAFLKVTHLLDPIRWMKGHYSLPKHTGLPWHHRTWTAACHKLQDPWNQAYVEAMASYAFGRLREEGVSPHFNLFYGAFCARAETYRYNLTDDFGSFRNSRWLWNGRRRGLYELRVLDANNPTLPVPADIQQIVLTPPERFDTSDEESGDSASEEEIVVEGGESREDGAAELASLRSDALSSVGYATEEEEETSTEEDGDVDGEDSDSDSSASQDYKIYAEFSDFPTMLIAVEENRGTMDALLDDYEAVGAKPGTAAWEERWSAWLFQVIAMLTTAQELLAFTHNDLHTNNLVWTETAEEYFYYTTRAGAVFRVPTFGKLFRLIDFGRAIFRINQAQFISDDFRAGNDADGQYAFKPLHPRPREIVEPNASFDLCRLAVSLFDAIFPEAPPEKEGGRILSNEKVRGEELVVRETVSPLYNALWSWMLDDDGRNVLIEPNGDERFPDFDLYKHIAAKVHGAVPAQQLAAAAFDRFQVAAADVPAEARKWSLFV